MSINIPGHVEINTGKAIADNLSMPKSATSDDLYYTVNGSVSNVGIFYSVIRALKENGFHVFYGTEVNDG